MNNYTTQTLVLLAISLTACGSPKSNVDNSEFYKAWGLRFKECMELAAKNSRESDDDVSNLVESCHNSSLYMTIYLEKNRP